MKKYRNAKICPVCNGKGRISRVKQTSNGNICEFEICYHCKGTGKIDSVIWSKIRLLWERRE